MSYDVAIIGASSSGLYAAEKLAHAGASVVVLERSRELKPARRTLIVTPEFLRALAPAPEVAILHETRWMEIEAGGNEARVRLDRPDLIIERAALAKHLLMKAETAGAEVHMGARFQGFEAAQEGVALHVEEANGRETRLSASAVIGADGIYSSVGRSVGIAPPPTQPIVQAEVNLPVGWDPAVTKVWFETDNTRFFYWLIPESKTRAVAGLVGDGRRNTRALLEAFLERLGLEPLAYQGARVAMHHPGLRPWAEAHGAPVLLVGDAAGQVKVTTVGGTVTGFAGAEAAARALTSGTPYRQALKPLKRELDLQWGIRLLLDQLDTRGYEQLVAALTPRVRGFLAEHNRDRMAPVFWRLFLEPRLWVVGAGAVARLMVSPLRLRAALGGAGATEGQRVGGES